MLRQLVVLLLLPTPALAQSIRGNIVDAASGEHISGVNITVYNREGRPDAASLGNEQGQFQLTLRPGTMVRLQFQRLGYRPVISSPVMLKVGEVLDLEVRLAASAVPLQAITVLAPQLEDPRVVDFYRRAGQSRMMGKGRIWTRSDLEKMGTVPISEVLRTVSSRASCTRSEVYIDGLPVSTRPTAGSAADRPSAIGALMPAPPAPDAEGIDLVDWLVDPEQVEGIELYRDSEIPLEFNRDGQLCQVTLIWRKPYGENGSPLGYHTARMALVLAAIFFASGWLFERLR